MDAVTRSIALELVRLPRRPLIEPTHPILFSRCVTRTLVSYLWQRRMSECQ